MALNAQTLEQMIISIYRNKLREAFPEVVKGGTVTMIPKEDGTFEFKEAVNKGPMELDEAQFRPLAAAIASAVVEHLKSSGEVPDTDPTNGGTWRIT